MEKDRLLDLYREMVLIRRMEEESARLYQEGLIGGFLHLYIGQEAVASGILSARKSQDRVITAYRDHGVAIAAGVGLKEVMAELLGKETGTSRGRGGSMHLADVERNFWGGHAIVGAHLPLAAGMALADKYRGQDGITICLFGDGATNIGYFHEALNLSMVWELPVLWVCENNHYGMGTSVERASAVSEIHRKADGYGMDSERIEGMNVIDVRAKAQKIIERVRSESKPFLLEVVTYRFMGHSMGDPERYREKEEVEKWRDDDPIGIYRRHLMEKEKFDKNALDEVEEQVEAQLQEAVEFARSSPEPDPDTLFDNIYVEEAG
jgi:pyruvate dehydrogenase E1 component alpha subunit